MAHENYVLFIIKKVNLVYGVVSQGFFVMQTEWVVLNTTEALWQF